MDPKSKSAEALEEETFERLSKALKRPASKAVQSKAAPVPKAGVGKAKTVKPVAKAQTKAKAKAKGKAKSQAASKSSSSKPVALKLGCLRCRGGGKNVGCSTCQNPLYNGVRCPGRQAWKDYMKSIGKPCN